MVDDALSQLGELYDTHAPRIFRYIYHRVGIRAVAEDLTSEVFVRFLRVRTKPDNVPAYLFRMAHNLIVDYLRQTQPVELSDELANERDDPANLAEDALLRVRVRRAIARLTPDQQQVVVLKFLEGFANEEIAQIIGKPVGAVKALQHRALVMLRDWLAVERLREGKP